MEQTEKKIITNKKFIRILNRDLNISSINSIFFNKENKEITFILNFLVGEANNKYNIGDKNNLLPETFRLYLESEKDYELTGTKLLNELVESKMFIVPCSNEPNRLDVINLDNVSFIRYNENKLTITFNFKNSICRNGVYVSDFIHWKFSSLDSYLQELKNVNNNIVG